MDRTWACSALGNSMNNLTSYCGLVDARIRAYDKDLPVHFDKIFMLDLELFSK